MLRLLAAGVPLRRINEFILGKRGVTADTALRLAAFFGTSEGFSLQDLDVLPEHVVAQVGEQALYPTALSAGFALCAGALQSCPRSSSARCCMSRAAGFGTPTSRSTA